MRVQQGLDFMCEEHKMEKEYKYNMTGNSESSESRWRGIQPTHIFLYSILPYSKHQTIPSPHPAKIYQPLAKNMSLDEVYSFHL